MIIRYQYRYHYYCYHYIVIIKRRLPITIAVTAVRASSMKPCVAHPSLPYPKTDPPPNSSSNLLEEWDGRPQSPSKILEEGGVRLEFSTRASGPAGFRSFWVFLKQLRPGALTVYRRYKGIMMMGVFVLR